MDPSTPSTSRQPDLALVEENEDLEDVDENDPMQLAMDESSNDDSEEEEDEEDDTKYDVAPTWCPKTNGMRQIPFTNTDQLLVDIPGQNKPIDWFNLLLDVVLLESICRYTNQYAFEVLYKPTLTPKSRICKWKELNVEELKTFLGIILHMGTNRLNRIQDYWKTEWLFDYKCFRQSMSRDRFLLILRCLHFSKVENDSKTGQSMLKISEIVGYFNSKMLSVYSPQKELSIDEAMILWRGRLYFRQYIKGKRHKYGIKLYTLTEHQGLILKFFVYGGSSDKVVGGKGHTEKVVLHLMRERLDHGHSLYMDNFYNSFRLSAKLLANKTYSTGTLRVDRKNTPVEVKTALLKKGETVARYGNGVMVGKWRDERVVTYISTEHENYMVEFVNKRKQTKHKPYPIVKYNAHMSGVDRSDQMLSYYPCDRKTMRWYKKVFIHIVQMILLNSHYLYNMYNSKVTFYDFRLDIIRVLLPKPIEELEGPAQKRLRQATHKITKSTERDGQNRLKRKNCRVCWKKVNKKIKTAFFCATCPDNPGLCLGECFEVYHDKL